MSSVGNYPHHPFSSVFHQAFLLVGLCLLLSPAFAQSTVVAGGGAAGKAISVRPSGPVTRSAPVSTYSFKFAIGGTLHNPKGIAADYDGNLFIADTDANRIVKIDSNGYYLGKIGTAGKSNAQFNTPSGVAVDSLGNIYVSDSSNNRIQKFDANGNWIWSVGKSGTAAATGNVQFKFPAGIAADSFGNVYVADSNNSRIIELDTNGNFVRVLGTKGSGNGQFTTPSGVAVDDQGNIYVADTGNNRVQAFNNSGTLLWLDQSYNNDNYHFIFSTPTSIAVDNQGIVYVGDTGANNIKEIATSNGAVLQTICSGGNGTYQLSNLCAIAVDGYGDIFATDIAGYYAHSRVVEYDINGNGLAQYGSPYSIPGQFNTPGGIAVDSAGYIVVADTMNYRVQRFNRYGAFVKAFGGTSTSNNTGFSAPQGVAVDPNGNVYVADSRGYSGTYYNNNRVVILDSGLNYSTERDSVGNLGYFNLLMGVAVDSNSNLYVADTANHLIEQFNSTGVFQWSLGGYGTGSTQLEYPGGIAVDKSGYLYVADTYNNRVRKIAPNRTTVWTVGSYGTDVLQFQHPTGVAVDTAGNVYVADTANNRVQVLDSDGNYVTQFSPDAWGDVNASTISGIALDSQRNVYLTDVTNNRVIVFSTSNPLSAPTLTSVSPANAIAGSGATVITLIGTGFDVTSIAKFNGVALTTTYGSSTALTATVPASLLTAAGSYPITVTASGGTSGSLPFVVTAGSPKIDVQRSPVPVFTRNASNITVAVKVVNTGTAAATNVVIRGARLGSTAATTGLTTVTSIPAGGSATLNLTFPTSAVAVGSTSAYVYIDYTSANGGMGTLSTRVTSP